MAKAVPAQLAPEFRDDEFRILETSFEQIQTCLGMYLAGEHPDEQPFHEIFNNALDECTNEHSPGNEIVVTINENTCEQIVTDNGRGLPHEKMIDACTRNHVSTKFGRLFNKYSSGQNGVGLKVCVAVSSFFSMESSRSSKITKFDDAKLNTRKGTTISKTIAFTDCELDDREPVVKEGNIHGTTVKFVPNEKYLGPFEMTVDRIHDYLRHMSYCIPKDLHLVLNGIRKGETDVVTYEIPASSLEDNVNYLTPHLEFPPITISMICDDADLAMSFSYDGHTDQTIIDSYANYVITTEGGEHESVCINAICGFFTKEAKKLDPNHQYEVIFDDCKKGLIMAVDLHHVDPKFEGQHKAKVGNKNIRELCRADLVAGLEDYFKTNTTLLRKIITYLRKMAKIRLDVNKVKNLDTKSTSSFIEDAEIHMFYPIANRYSKRYKELLITEGDSASSALNPVRNPEYQAIFTLRGVVPNIVGMSLAQVMQKEIFRNLIKVIGCGVGKDFDINKCRYNKIIIVTDGDTDGDHIASLLICFFYMFFPELITHKMVYRIMPPLYIINSKTAKKLNRKDNERYFYSKKEIVEAKNKRIADTTDITIFPFDNPKQPLVLNKHAKYKWLDETKNYLTYLNGVRCRIGADVDDIEHVCECILLTGYDPTNPDTYKKFMKEIKKHFPEVEFDPSNKSIYGSHKQRYMAIIVDDIFMNAAKKLMKAMNIAYTFEVEYFSDKLNPTHGRVSVGKFLEIANAGFNIDLDQRYKGLGEIERTFLFISTMNPNIRKLYLITDADSEKSLEVLRTYHVKSDAMRERRRELLDAEDYTVDDLDN